MPTAAKSRPPRPDGPSIAATRVAAHNAAGDSPWSTEATLLLA